MPFAKVSMFLLTVLIVAIQAQWTPDDSGAFLGQTGLRLRNQLHTGYSLSNQGLRTYFSRMNGGTQASLLQQLRSVPLQSATASIISLRSIPIVDYVVDPELLGPNEGIGHDDPLQFTNVLTAGLGVSSETVSNRDDPPVCPYLIPGRISPFRGPKGEVFCTTGDVALLPIVPNLFNRLPELGGNGNAVTSSGENINIQVPRSRRPRGQFGLEH